MPRPPIRIEEDSRSLKFLYETVVGRCLLKVLCAPLLSRLVGFLLSRRVSRPLIRMFVRKNNINLDEYEKRKYTSFNDCFTRRILPELRPIDMDDNALIAPCDGYLSVYDINDDTVIPVKQSRYSIADLLGVSERNEIGTCDEIDSLVDSFRDGICLVFRLCVHHYHRYHFFDEVIPNSPYFIRGKLHTVRPIALRNIDVFTRNAREVTVMDTANFGRAAQIEVGAMLVGKIHNHQVRGPVERGQEKGMFLYGGSTVILLLEKNRAVISDEFYRNTKEGLETPVLMGERIGEKWIVRE